MILLETKPIEMGLCDCLQASLVAAAKIFNREFRFMFAGVWVFGFKSRAENDNSFFWERLSTPYYVNPVRLIDMYYGIGFWLKDLSDFGEFLTVVEKELLEGRPMIIKYDAFNAAWTQFHKKYHMDHFSLVVGLDKETETLYVVDPYVSNKVEKFPVSEMGTEDLKYGIFDLGEPEKDISEWKPFIKGFMEHKFNNEGNESSFQMIRVFGEELLSSDSFIQEMRKQNNNHSFELFYQMKYMYNSRENFAMFLRYIESEFSIPELGDIAKLMLEASTLWKLIWLKFTKLSYLDKSAMINNSIKKISDSLMKIAEIEEKVAQELLNITSK